ncbi:MAG TPA: L-threonine 3-dehydrogenase [Opitutaceae bacterium]
MKAIAKTVAGPGLEMIEAPVPQPGPNDVVIKIKKTAICGTDVHIYKWDDWASKTIKPPMIIGHEYVGTVVEVGGNVTDFKPGQLVTGEGHLICGTCRNCLAGRRHLCNATKGVGVNRDGAFAEYLSIPHTNVWPVDPRIPTDVIACFDPLGNAVHTALQFDLLGEDVLITGAGPIGCMAAAVARHAGARYIVVTDLNPDRLTMAKRMGADRVVNVREEKLADTMRDLGMREGFDVGLEMSGSPAALNDMIAHMFHGGKIALLGIPPKDFAIDWNKVIFSMLTLKGIYGREMFETWYKMTAMVQGGMDISAVITHRFPVAQWQEAFELMASGKSGKIILNWEN